MNLAALFLFCYSLILTLSPAVRSHSWAVDYRWWHWIGFVAWLVIFALAHRQTTRFLPDRDPYLLPICALLTGWGLLTIWRLSTDFGARQTVWLAISGLLLMGGLRLSSVLDLLRRYKYLWLTSGLLITGLTFIFGTYPNGVGPHLWLGCCGLYFMPSEPLKLLLIAYLAAYLADQLPISFNLLQLLAPTLVLTGVALLLLVAQRDLGTASLFIFLYAGIIYFASGRKRVLLTSLVAIGLASVAGYLLFDVVRLRVDAWLNPWLDPSGRSYQIVQSLLAISAGGLFGNGPGLGSPSLVPIARSDFIFASIGEEAGMIGTLGLLLLLGLLILRGMLTSLRASNGYQRYLAAGLTLYLTGQSLLIIGGNLRLLPLTGVTLPFVSYGGSSLVTSFLSMLILLRISNQPDQEPAPLPSPRPYLYLSGMLIAGLLAAALINGWWSIVRGPDLLTRNDNARRAITDRYVVRGSILDRDGQSLDVTAGVTGDYTRQSNYPPLSPILGYTSPIYGQAGLEDSLDPYLRGLQGNPSSLVEWNELLYGQPPPGVDARLSLDLGLQQQVDQLLGAHNGAAVLLNAQTGEVLAMASHPYFDANTLDEDWNSLVQNKNAPLLNRAVQGQYPPGTALGPFLMAAATSQTGLPALPTTLAYTYKGYTLDCSLKPQLPASWEAAISDGCPNALAALGQKLGDKSMLDLFTRLGFYSAPQVNLPQVPSPSAAVITDANAAAIGQQGLTLSPLQMALAAAALSNNGVRPAPHLVAAIHFSQQEWVSMAADSQPVTALSGSAATSAAEALAIQDLPSWESVGSALSGENQKITWFVGGSLPTWKGTPLALAVVIEEDAPAQALQIGEGILHAAQKQ